MAVFKQIISDIYIGLEKSTYVRMYQLLHNKILKKMRTRTISIHESQVSKFKHQINLERSESTPLREFFNVRIETLRLWPDMPKYGSH